METKFAFAQELIRKAGKLILSEMDCKLRIEEKSQFDDLVTNLDQKAQDFLVTSIQERYPDDHFLAEEDEVRHPIGDGKVWVLDPIDGTVNFIVQGQQFAVMIAYYEDGQGRFGLIYDVMNDMLYSGGGQFDVYANEQRLPVYINQPFNRSLIASNATMYAENY